ncbi:MAG: hypothetical protein JWM38_112 [Sphingomonas bacterium]|nr:hypothetical protein [Sphingomonas bacterium]
MSRLNHPMTRLAACLPAGSAKTVLAVALVALPPAALALGMANPAPAIVACLLGLAWLIARILGVAQVERFAEKLAGEQRPERRPLALTLPRIAARLAEMEHRWLARHPVTGLPTREYLFAAIAAEPAASRSERLLGAIRLADYDRLAAFDQPLADAALGQFARRIAAAAGATHAIAQIDRDCLAIWFGGVQELDAARAAFRAIVYVAAQDITDGDHILSPTIEAGSASPGDGGTTPAQLLNQALTALSRPDSASGGQIVLADAPSPAAARDRFVLEQALAQAIGRDQLTMMFQPVVDVARGRLVGAEALLRWTHPELGAVSPARFIPIVEEIGLSERYGLWVLNAACREARAWQDEGLHGLKVAVNLSARQLLDPMLRPKIERTLARHGLAPDALELELTETAAMVDAARTLELFVELHAMGISLALDDFGTGYSSLSYLKNLRFDKLKIDREFVTQLQDRRDSRAICKALIELARGLDLTVLAEGVEDAREVETLRMLGCNLFQGYYFARPMPGADFRALAANREWLASFASPVHRQIETLEGRLSA